MRKENIKTKTKEGKGIVFKFLVRVLLKIICIVGENNRI